MSGRKPKYDNRILRYLTKNGPTTQAALAKGLKISPANIYPIIKRMVEQNALKMVGKLVGVVREDPRIPLFGSQRIATTQEAPKVDAPVHPLIKIFQEEIEDIDAGIRSLQITRSYMVRRIESIRVNV